MRLKAEKASSLVLDTLATEPVMGRVHSVFEKTVNILWSGSNWVSLHPAGVELHPYCIILEDTKSAPGKPGFLGAVIDEPASVSRTHIDVGDGRVIIDLRDVLAWQCRVNPPEEYSDVNLGRASDRLMALAGSIDVQSVFLNGVLRHAGIDTDLHGPELSVFAAKAGETIQGIETAWQLRRIDSTLDAVRGMIGLGQGLTPSGDDFLTGFLGGSYFFSRADQFRKAVFDSMRVLIDRTSLPSHFMLKAALGGLYPEPLTALLGSLAQGDNLGSESAFDSLSHIGATSGQDMLAGVLCWLEIAAAAGVIDETHSN